MLNVVFPLAVASVPGLTAALQTMPVDNRYCYPALLHTSLPQSSLDGWSCRELRSERNGNSSVKLGPHMEAFGCSHLGWQLQEPQHYALNIDGIFYHQ